MNSVRTPRVSAQINGAPIDTIMHADMTMAGSGRSSRFELTASTISPASKSDWLGLLNDRISVEIFVRSQAAGIDISLFEGLADSVTLDPINEVASIHGRDFSSILSDTTSESSFCNQTASEIASYIADRHGFSQSISTTSQMVGSYQSGGYNQVLLNAHSRATSEWDLLTQLAKIEGFEVFVDGTTLVFAPSTSLAINRVSISRSDVSRLALRKRCPLSNSTTLTVKSWNSWLGNASVYSGNQSSESPATDVTGMNNNVDTGIVIVRPNLTQQSAQQMGQQYMNALNQQLFSVDIVMPGELILKPNDTLSVEDSSAGFPMDYTVKSVRRHFSSSGGFVEYIKGQSTGAGSLLLRNQNQA